MHQSQDGEIYLQDQRSKAKRRKERKKGREGTETLEQYALYAGALIMIKCKTLWVDNQYPFTVL